MADDSQTKRGRMEENLEADEARGSKRQQLEMSKSAEFDQNERILETSNTIIALLRKTNDILERI